MEKTKTLECPESLSGFQLSAAMSVEPIKIIGPDVHFDGHAWWPPGDAGQLAVIEMAYRARRGAESAIAVLTAFKIKVMSGNGDRQYWPMSEEDKQVRSRISVN